MSGRLVSWILAAVLLAFAARVVSTYGVFNDTRDENDHIEAGLEYWQLGRYAYEPQHPPLARLAVSALPYFFSELRLGEERILLGDERTKPLNEPRVLHETFLWAGAWQDGPPEFYWRTLALARAGNLLFAALLLAAVGAWTFELFGPRAAVAAGLLAAFSPNLLAHAGLATLDLAVAATVIAAAYAFWRWTRRPTPARAALAGLVAAVAFTSKFSTLAFLPPVWLAYLWLERGALPSPKPLARQAALAVVVCGASVWAVYGFDVGPVAPEGEIYLSPHEQGTPAPTARVVASWFGSASVPAPRLVQGVIDVLAHNDQGHAAYLLGEWSKSGRWTYFPVALGVKTTLPLLILAVWGAVAGLRADRRRTLVVLAPAAAVLLVAMPSGINIGIRHVLPVYAGFAMLGAIVFRDFAFARWKRPAVAAAGALVVWHGGESLAAGPDHLAYFNEIARGRETAFLLDSNLDWGQDLARLGRWMGDEDVPAVILRYFGEARPGKLGVNTYPLPAGHPDAGWFAISANLLFGMEGSSPQLRALAEQAPEARVGRSIFVYRIDPNQVANLAPPWFFERYERTPPPPGFEP